MYVQWKLYIQGTTVPIHMQVVIIVYRFNNTFNNIQ